MYGNYDPNLNNQPMTQQNQVPPNFQQTPPVSMGQGFSPNAMGMYQPDAATITGLNQSLANAIKAANAPKSPWAQGQDISNSIFGNVVAPFAGALGYAGADDAAKYFKDQLDSDKKTRSDMLKSNIDQIKDITSSFDGLNRTQVAELGRKTAETNAQRALQVTQAQVASKAADLAFREKQLQENKRQFDALLPNKQKDSETKATLAQDKVKNNAILTPAKAALMGQTATLRGAQAKEAPLTGQAKRDAMMAKTKNDSARTDIYGDNSAERAKHDRATETTQAKNANTSAGKAETLAHAEQRKTDNPNSKAATLAKLFGGPDKVATAPQASQGATPHPAMTPELHAFLHHQFGNDAGAAKAYVQKMGIKF